MKEIVIQINGETMISVDVSVKNVMYVEKFMFGILLHVIMKMENIEQVLWMIQQLCVMKLKSHTRKKHILMKSKQPVKHKIFIFCFHFY